MNLRIIKGGILDSIQDNGRYGFQHLGLNPGGTMDKLAAQIGNILVGNSLNEAVIELHFPASEYFFEQTALIAITGADFVACINGDEVPCHQPIIVSKFSILQFYRMKSGARAYISVRGGFDIPSWFNSHSTNLKAMAGGYKGRILQKDDEIGLQSYAILDSILAKKEYHVFPWKANTGWEDNQVTELLAIPGKEWQQLTAPSKESLEQASFMITSHSDRMGYRLSGQSLSLQTKEELVSSAVSFGTVQLLPNGQLIVLMADHQTTGGYPRVAHVISAHHSRLAQLNPGERIQFRFCDHAVAESMLAKQQQHVLQLEHACKFKLEGLGISR
jgi:antagonist of KipI